MAYDPQARRETPLAMKLAERIRRAGPITVEDYMRACLFDGEHGYYVTRPAIGGAGDFVTAPEISQTFGELIGLWCAVVWQHMGSPARFALVELGPGRGTLMADALRALRRVPACLAAVSVRLIETNVTLQAVQASLLHDAPAPVSWQRTLMPDAERLPAIIVANEFVDAQPVAQFVGDETGWRQRLVGLDANGRLVFVTGAEAEDELVTQRFSKAHPGDIAELRPPDDNLSRGLIGASNAAALVVDYGHTQTMAGDTLQAVRRHTPEHPLCSPGEADLTAQVDFAALADQSRAAGLSVDGPITQAEFLGALGIVERASRLMTANPLIAHDIEAGIARLLSPTGMGTRFKVLGIRSPGLAALPGFPVSS